MNNFLGKDEWKFVYSEANSLIVNDAFFSGFTEYDPIPGMLYKIFYIYRNGVHTCYSTEKELSRLKGQGKLFFSENYRKKFMEKIKSTQREFENFYLHFCRLNISKSSDKELLALFLEYIEHLKLMFAYYQVSGGRCFPLVEEEIKKNLKQYIESGKLDKVYSTLLTPTKFSKLEKEELDMRKLAEKKNLLEKDLLTHAEKYSLLFINVYDKKLILRPLKCRIKIIRKEKLKFSNLNEELTRKKRLIKQEQTKIYKLVEENKKIIKLSEFLREQGWIRFEYKEWKNGAEYKFLSLFEEIAKRAKLKTREFLLTFLVKDVKDFLDKGITPKATERNNRLKASVFWKNKKNKFFYSGKRAETLFKTLIQGGLQTTELKGIVANTGMARGKARIFLPMSWENLSKEMSKFVKGEILITTMTEPNLISVMKKAAAVVTNQGGMTSHAAIVSRELNIPCVVATYRATEIFKTGDLVEVDANKGIVKLIKSA